MLQALPGTPVTLLRIRGVLLSWECMFTVLKSGSYDLLLRLHFSRKRFSTSWKVLIYAWASSTHLCEENKPIYEVSYIHASSLALFQAKYYWNSLFQFFNISRPSCQKLLRSFSSIPYGPSTLLRHLEGWRRALGALLYVLQEGHNSWGKMLGHFLWCIHGKRCSVMHSASHSWGRQEVSSSAKLLRFVAEDLPRWIEHNVCAS